MIVKDLPLYCYYLYANDDKYLQLKNRLEKISVGPNEHGYVCLWPDTSRLHAPLVIPKLGSILLKKCLTKSYFRLADHRSLQPQPRLTVLIGHRGMERLPLLLATIQSLAGQTDVELECIVIEQDVSPRIKVYLPSWTRYIFMQTATESDIYNRSAGYNYGAKFATGDVLLLHDNDMLVPNTYCRDIVRIVDQGYEAVNTKRYVFYLNRAHSLQILKYTNSIPVEPPDYIVQNLEAGGSMAITKEAFQRIGGMDEDFVGWGGEDIEFWNRCTLLNRWIWGYEPIIHLWHRSQPLKFNINNPNIARLKNIDAHNIHERINHLKSINNQGI